MTCQRVERYLPAELYDELTNSEPGQMYLPDWLTNLTVKYALCMEISEEPILNQQSLNGRAP